MARQAAKTTDEVAQKKHSSSNKDESTDSDSNTDTTPKKKHKHLKHKQQKLKQSSRKVWTQLTPPPPLIPHWIPVGSGPATPTPTPPALTAKGTQNRECWTESGASSVAAPSSGGAVLPQFRSLDGLLEWENDRRARLASGIAYETGSSGDLQNE